MQEIFPNAPFISSAVTDAKPVCEWIVPVFIPARDYVRARKKLPPGMPDCLEVHVVHSEEGVERSTALIYGARAYLIHYDFKHS